MYCGRTSLRTSISTLRPQMEIVVSKRCVISFECNHDWEVVYKGDRIIIRQVQKAKSPEVELKDGDIYDKIIQLCKLRHMSMRQLAAIIEIPYTTLVSRISRRPKKVPETFINAVATALGVEPNELKEV